MSGREFLFWQLDYENKKQATKTPKSKSFKFMLVLVSKCLFRVSTKFEISSKEKRRFSSLFAHHQKNQTKWENISRQNMNLPWEDEIFFPLCLMLSVFPNCIFSNNIHQLFKLCAFIHFWYRVFFLHQRENNRSHPLMEGSHIGGKYSPIWENISRQYVKRSMRRMRWDFWPFVSLMLSPGSHQIVAGIFINYWKYVL